MLKVKGRSLSKEVEIIVVVVIQIYVKKSREVRAQSKYVSER